MRSVFTLHFISAFACGSLVAQLPEGIVDTQDPGEMPPSPQEALKKISVPEGFHVSLFAGEPDVAQPIAINYDDRGRLWVAESFSYIEWKRSGQDRILIFEDTDQDGTFDKRTVFWDKGNHLSGFQIGHGGVWVCDAPNLLFIPDGNRDDIPDVEPEIILDGWTTEAEHNFFNGLTWGPDGWLYGRHGIKKPSLVGRPGTPDQDRVPLSCGIWRYHPVRKTFELYADGTINPWGLDWNEEGQAFFTTSVIDHLWHLVPGARYSRWDGMGTASLNPHSYGLMEPASDHRHWIGGQTERKQEGVHDHAGGGHSHCGLMIYQSDSWPEEYRGRAYFSNVLGRRINSDILERSQSGYVAKHADDFLKGGSDWFRATDLKQGPFGEMMMSEWTDLGECHDRDGIHRSSGRIYRVWHGDSPKPMTFDVAAMNTMELVGLLSHENVWWRRHALRNLYEREQEGAEAVPILLEKAETGSVKDAVISLQALYAVTGSLDWAKSLYEKNSGAEREAVRAQILNLVFFGDEPSSEFIHWLGKQISEEDSRLVQMWMAAALQRIPLEARWPGVELLSKINIPADDRNLTLMRWYATEPLVNTNLERALKLALSPGHPTLSENIARRAVSLGRIGEVLAVIDREPDSEACGRMLEGALAALPAQMEMPEEWGALSAVLQKHPEKSIQRSAFRLAQRFGDPDAAGEMVRRARDSAFPAEERLELMSLLVSSRSELLKPHISELMKDEVLGEEAIRAISVFPEKDSAGRLLSLLQDPEASSSNKSAALETLASRKEFADALVDAFLENEITREAIPAYAARQIVSVSSRGGEFSKEWGMDGADLKKKEALLAKWKKRLPEEYLAAANPEEGRHVFLRVCSACHQLYGEGGIIGPDLTGSNRSNLDYFLINVLFPGEDVSEGYQLVTLTLKDGRVLTGNIAEENDQVIVFRQVGQSERIDQSQVASRVVSDVSLMPPGLIDALSREDVRDLIGYLRTSEALP